jgi:putative ABC transport system ATP-binding protein
VLVTHDPHVARWCSRLIEIRDGLVHADRVLAAGWDEAHANGGAR